MIFILFTVQYFPNFLPKKSINFLRRKKITRLVNNNKNKLEFCLSGKHSGYN